jgi:hypothetical protein
MPTLEQVQAKVRARCNQPTTGPRKLDWMRISPQVLRADDYEIHRSGTLGAFTYELRKTPFGEVLHTCDSAQEAIEAAALHQVLE